MARSGVHKSEIQRARDRVLAQGRHPSIDTVRAELGNTGSKTTIQRYLRELEEEEGVGLGGGVAVSEAIQELVSRLAARLQEEAESRITEARSQFDAQLGTKEAALAQLRTEVESLSSQLQCTAADFQGEKRTHGEAIQALVTANTANERLTQQVADLNDRLKDNETHRQSLEEKHRHARDALDHYRQSVKDQREQEQRRHEQQVQQMKVDVRALNQALIGKQNELTQLHQELAKMTAELGAARKDLRRSELDAGNTAKARDQYQQRVADLEPMIATLTERLQHSEARRNDAGEALAVATAKVSGQEVEIAQLRVRLQGQVEMQALLKQIQQRRGDNSVATTPEMSASAQTSTLASNFEGVDES